jgi:hypothetical protein
MVHMTQQDHYGVQPSGEISGPDLLNAYRESLLRAATALHPGHNRDIIKEGIGRMFTALEGADHRNRDLAAQLRTLTRERDDATRLAEAMRALVQMLPDAQREALDRAAFSRWGGAAGDALRQYLEDGATPPAKVAPQPGPGHPSYPPYHNGQQTPPELVATQPVPGYGQPAPRSQRRATPPPQPYQHAPTTLPLQPASRHLHATIRNTGRPGPGAGAGAGDPRERSW